MLRYVRADNSLRKFCEREVKKTEFGFCSQECENKPRGPARLVTPRTVFILGGKDVRSPSHLKEPRVTTTHNNRKES